MDAVAVPISRPDGFLIGTGTVIGPGRLVTALHVVDPEPEVRAADGLEVVAVVSLPVRRYGAAVRQLARRSYQRARALTAIDIGTVDLTVLVVPGLRGPPVTVRPGPVFRGERVTMPGYPAGRPGLTAGPITSLDAADFVAHLVVGPGCSGAPALDTAGRLIGIATLDHESAGGLFVGPVLLAALIERTARLVARLLPDE